MILKEMSEMSSSDSNIYGPLDDGLAQKQNRFGADFVIEMFDEIGEVHDPDKLKETLLTTLNTSTSFETPEGIYKSTAKRILAYLKDGSLGIKRDPFVRLSDEQKLTVLMHHLAKFVGDNVTFEKVEDKKLYRK